MNRKQVVLSLVVLLAVCWPAHAVRLRYKFTKGEVLRYKMMMAGALRSEGAGMPAIPIEFSGDGTHTEKVLSVDASGTARIATQTSMTMKMKMGEGEQTMPFPADKSTIRVTSRGKTTFERAGEGEQAGMPDLSGTGFDFSQFAAGAMEFPERDLKVGESWSGTAKVASKQAGDVPMTYSGKLTGFTNYKGSNCAVVQIAFEVPLDFTAAASKMPFSMSGKMAATMKLYFDLKRGREVYSTGEILSLQKMSTQMGEQSSEVNITMKMNLKQYLLR